MTEESSVQEHEVKMLAKAWQQHQAHGKGPPGVHRRSSTPSYTVGERYSAIRKKHYHVNL
ncbi:UNVERIFIED_CONTAM: hypothetical protein Sradi_5745400 [Sesamum radiatum]|uniref:Uncharacterized protein n=1 Tax=Sesamum radiatum TaxID=300843 RepID=A0AAW2L5S0_SESRA